MVEWFEDEAYWIECYAYLFSDERLDNAARQVRQILALTGLSGGSVLDLCCGPGSHAVALAQQGLCVTGVDRSRFLLARARERAETASVEVEFILDDMRRFVRPQAFDCVINMYSSFGYFENAEDDLLVLRNVHNSLKPGGVCLIDMVSQEWLANFVEPLHTSKEPDGTVFIQHHEIINEGTRQVTRWTIIKGAQERSFKFSIRIYSGQELKERMLKAGFAEVDLYSDLEGRKYGRTADRLIAVGRKA